MTYSRWPAGDGFVLVLLVSSELDQEFVQVRPSELPLGRLGNRFVVRLEIQERLFHGLHIRELIGYQDLALDNGEINLNLVQPTGVHRGVDLNRVSMPPREPLLRYLSPVRRAMVGDPENPVSPTIGFLPHHQVHQTMVGLDSRRGPDNPNTLARRTSHAAP